MKNSNLSRRVFLSGSLAAGMGLLFWFNNTKVRILDNEEQVLLHTAYHLFPSSKLGPGAVDLHISSYLGFVLKDKRILEGDKKYLLQGAAWLEESAFEFFDKSFLNLSHEKKEELLKRVTQNKWAENYVYNVLSYVFEALLCSPVYGSNPDEIGWKWLEHNPGFPQPSQINEISYDV